MDILNQYILRINSHYVTQQQKREIECVNSPVFLCLMSLEALALAYS